MTYDCDVLVVGAGPVGMTMALELALQGVPFRIVDQLAVRNDKSRALVIQPRTLELLNRHGAADSIVRRGRVLRGGSSFINRKLVAKINLDDLGTTDTEFPLPLNVSQVETERFLDECLATYNISVERPVTASNISQDETGVTTTLEHPDGNVETIRSKYIVGCDGAHSAVRHASTKMTFPGAAYPQDFILFDVHLRDSNIFQDRLSLHLNNKGVVAFLPLQGNLMRVVVSGNQIMTATKDDVPTLEQFQAHITDKTPPGSGTLYDPIWMTRFRLHHRCVTQYRDGRLFVAGDAAHIHSPAGGQGMNAGIQDAINLGWKLAHALRLESTPHTPSPNPHKPTLSPAQASLAATALLDTYDLERRPVGLTLLRGTDRLFSFLTAPKPWFVPVRNFVMTHVMPRVSKYRSRRKKMFHFISQFGVNYRGTSRIVGEAAGGGGFFGGRGEVRGGDRVPDGGLVRLGKGKGEERSVQRVCVGRWHHLLLFSGDVKTGKGWKAEELEGVAERVVDACRAEVKVHYIAGDESAAAVENGEEWYADSKDELHVRFGFGNKAGYVLVRPDGYVAHIGPLAKVHQLLAFLEGYLVSPVVTPVRSRMSLIYPVVWAVVGACLAAKVLGRLGLF